MNPEFAEWALEVWGAEFGYPLSRPMLCGPRQLRADIGDDGELCITGMDDQFAVSVPMYAVCALMKAHSAWLAATRETAEEDETRA